MSRAVLRSVRFRRLPWAPANACFVAVTIAWFHGAANTARAAEGVLPPNVLLVMTDDQGWGDVHAHGNERLDTPVLDRLRSESVRFERFFVSPVCAPTRAALLTGRWPSRTGVSGVTGRQEVMRADEVTLAEVFQGAGYTTGCFGKWHNGEQYPNHPRGQGFDEFLGFCGGHWNDYFDATLEHEGRPIETKGYITDVLTDATLRFLEKHAHQTPGHQTPAPFLCYVPFNAPHSPWQLPDPLFEKYRAGGFDEATASAYGMVENLDGNIGRLLEKLEELEIAERTIVVFLTDNGPNGPRFNGGMKGAKGSVHEGGVRVPCFVRWKGTLEPRSVERTAAHVDLLPTLAALCGIAPPTAHPLDGRSLVPLFRGEGVDWPERPIMTYRETGGGVRGAVRTERWRFVRENKQDQLYDMLADPGQKTNVAGEQADVLRELRTTYEAFAATADRDVATPVPIPVGYAESPIVELPSVEAVLTGGVRFENGSGFAHDWVTNWTDTDDALTWNIEVATAGRYEVTLSYACARANVGARLELTAGDSRLTAAIEKPFDEPRWARPERTMEKGPRWMRDFTTTTLGTIDLPRGRVPLVLRATAITGGSAAEVDAIRLRRVAE